MSHWRRRRRHIPPGQAELGNFRPPQSTTHSCRNPLRVSAFPASVAPVECLTERKATATGHAIGAFWVCQYDQGNMRTCASSW